MGAVSSALKICADYVFPWWKKKGQQSELDDIEKKQKSIAEAVGNKDPWFWTNLFRK